MEIVNLPAGKTLKVSKFVPYGVGDEKAHLALDKHMAANNLERKDIVWEQYVNDPTQVKPENIQTDIFYPVN